MKRKRIVDLIISAILIVTGSIILIVPSIRESSVRFVFMVIMALSGIANLIRFLLINIEKDYESLLTLAASIFTLIILGLLDVDNVPLNLALTLFLWISIMSLIKLKKSDDYHKKYKKVWLLKIITLILFILSGLLTVINLYYEPNMQVVILGYFYLIYGILELINPIINYLIEEKKK